MKTGELFDELLELSSSYPRTFWLLLIGRSKHFTPETQDRCPPGAFVLFTFVGLYTSWNALAASSLIQPLEIADWLSLELALAIAFVVVGALVNLQATIVRWLFVETRSRLTGGVLVYPYCATTFMFLSVSYLTHPWLFLISQAFYVWTLFTVLSGLKVLTRVRTAMSALAAYSGFFLLVAVAHIMTRLIYA